MREVYLLLGGNIGNTRQNLRQAEGLININAGKVVKSSSYYRTAAWGVSAQPDYLNQALKIVTDLEPQVLLSVLQKVERVLGRKRSIHWGVRSVDIDILFYEYRVIDTPTLTVPHKQIPHRRFVLIPLYEIAPQLIHPILKKSTEELIQACEDTLTVQVLAENSEKLV